MTDNKSTAKKAPITVQNTYPPFIEKYHAKWNWIALGIITIVGFFIFKDFLLQEKLFLFKDIGSDTMNGVWPYHYHYADYLHKYGIPKWSFQEGMGQSIFSGWLRDPFEMIAYLLGASSIPKIFIYLEFLKIVLAGWTFYFFLRKWEISPLVSTIGGLMFAYSGFMIIGACWYLFTYEGLAMALLLLGFEKLYQQKKGFIFFLAVAAISISMPFDLYLFGIFFITYLVFRLWQDETFVLKKSSKLFLHMILLGVAGILVCAPFFLETLDQLFNSPRGSGENSSFNYFAGQPMFHLIDKLQFGTYVMRQFSSDLMGTGNQFSGWFNFLEAPVSYSSILSLVLLPLIFSYLNKKDRKIFLVFLIIWIITLIFPFFRTVVWAFTGEYYRGYSMFFVIIFVLYACIALDKIIQNGNLNIPLFVGTIILLLGFLHYDYFKNTKNFGGTQPIVDTAVSTMVHFFLIGYVALIFMLGKLRVKWAVYALAGLLCVEIISLDSLSVTRRDAFFTNELTQKVSYNDYTIEAVDYIKHNEKDLFYRIDKAGYYSSGAIHGSLNDNKIQGFSTTGNYNSFAQLNYVKYFKAFGVISKNNENEARWVPGLVGHPLLENQNAVKYVLIKQIIPPQWNFLFDSLGIFGDVKVLKNKYALPIGYTYSKVIKFSDFDKLTPSQKEMITYQTAVLDDEDYQLLSQKLALFNMKDTIAPQLFTFDIMKKMEDSLSSEKLVLDKFSNNEIKGKITVSQNKLMYMPFPLDKGWHLKLDGKEERLVKINAGMTGIYLEKGHHNVELYFTLPNASKGIVMAAFGFLLIILLLFFKPLKQL